MRLRLTATLNPLPSDVIWSEAAVSSDLIAHLGQYSRHVTEWWRHWKGHGAQKAPWTSYRHVIETFWGWRWCGSINCEIPCLYSGVQNSLSNGILFCFSIEREDRSVAKANGSYKRKDLNPRCWENVYFHPYTHIWSTYQDVNQDRLSFSLITKY